MKNHSPKKTAPNWDDVTHVAPKGEFRAEEFNLSEKIRYLGTGKSSDDEIFKSKDVREAVRLLKRVLKYNLVIKENFISLSETAFEKDIVEEIDKIFGEKLT